MWINCAIVFCIDTGAYSSWLFGWDTKNAIPIKLSTQTQGSTQTDTSRYCLTDEEKGDVYAFVEEKFPNDEHSQREWARFRGACTLLKKAFGDDWYQANVAAHSGDQDTFLRRSLLDEQERYLFVVRVIQLAQALYALRHVPGLPQRVSQSKGKTIESLWFEFFVPFIIQSTGHTIAEFIPEDRKKKPDVIAEFYAQLIPVEIKAIEEKTRYTRRNLLNLLCKAFGQLPGSGPGVVFLMVHYHWLQNEDFHREAASVIHRALLRNRNCNAIFVMWPSSERLPTGGFAYQWRFQHFVTWHPMYTIRRITDLISKTEAAYEPVQVTFL